MDKDPAINSFCVPRGSLCPSWPHLHIAQSTQGKHQGHKGSRAILLFSILLQVVSVCYSQKVFVSKVWVADNGNGSYKNPVIHADYSDPDVIRVGNDFYLIASSFDAVPGIPILHSTDLVNWTIIGYALKQQIPVEHFSSTRHGEGVWAPSIRFHKNEFYIYYPDPDFGIYLIKAKNITGPWSNPVLVEAGKGLIDPCPLWDDDGNVYLVHAFAGSRAGIKSVIVLKRLNAKGDQVIGDAVMVYDGHEKDPTIEGPKLYKRKGWYYIFAPAGGVATGWQTVLRSKNIYGPYERKIVLDQGSTTINGPHQGAWITTQTREDWFIHFQDKEAYGRVVHLQPMKWINDWPVIGEDKDGDGKGQPVLFYKKPNTGKNNSPQTPQDSDEFNSIRFGMQWQWQANPKTTWVFQMGQSLRLYAQPDSSKNLWTVPNLLLQKFPAEEFTATAKFMFRPNTINEKAGLVVMGLNYAYLSITKEQEGNFLTYSVCIQADKGMEEKQIILTKTDSLVYFRIRVNKGAKCNFSYSLNGVDFLQVNESFIATPGKWIGARLGLFCTRTTKTNDAGWADIDWFRIENVKNQ